MYNKDLKDIMIANFNNINPGSSLTANSYNAMCNMLIDASNTHMENTEVIDRELYNLKDTTNASIEKINKDLGVERARVDELERCKVDKVDGKGLSTNDYDNSAKSKVDAIPENPKYTDTVYDDTQIKEDINSDVSSITSKLNILTNDKNNLQAEDRAIYGTLEYSADSHTLNLITNYKDNNYTPYICYGYTDTQIGIESDTVLLINGQQISTDGAVIQPCTIYANCTARIVVSRNQGTTTFLITETSARNKWGASIDYEVSEVKSDLVTYQDYTFSNYGKENLLKYAVWIDGYYIQPSNGTTDVHASYSSTDYIELDNSKQYLCEVSGATWHYAFYDEDKVYIRGESIAGNYYWNLENNVKYCRVSMQTSAIPNNSLHISHIQQKLNPNIKVEKSSVLSDTTIITVAKDGTMEFTSLRQALESITDSSETHKYIVEFYGDGSHYDIAAEYSLVERQSLNGLTIPDYTTLVGIGGREKCIINCTFTSDESNRVFSALNMKTTSGIKGFTVVGRYTRNTLHHDFGDITNGTSVIENCTFIGSNLNLHYVCASGLFSGCKYIYKNCIFINETNVYTYSCHNGENFINTGFVEFENCRFKPTGDSGFSVRLGSITNQAHNINCVCVLKGCKIPIQLLLNEESAEFYGRGILWKVIGYANDITSTHIENTDGLDYSDNIDLIN